MAKCVIIDCRADPEAVRTLEGMGYGIIPTKKLDCLYDAIASHPDIQIHYMGGGSFVCAPHVYEHYAHLLPKPLRLIKGSSDIEGKYPFDVPYNAARTGRYVICRQDITDRMVKADAEVINVRQGYAKCSVCVVSANAVITADKGIAAATEKAGVDTLKISGGHIKLRTMEYGFIGGASGLIGEGLLAFNGELNTHPDGERIREFCKKHGTEIVEIKKGALEDIGSIICAYDVFY